MATDCTRRYKVLIKELFPGAAVVADKFHVLKMADLAVDEIRKAIHRGIGSSRTQLRLKQDKFVLKTRAHNLADWQRAKLDTWRADFPEIGMAYDTKEAYYRIYDAGSRQEAKLRFDIWRTSLPPAHGKYWKSIRITWGYWENEILAFGVPERADARHLSPWSGCVWV